MPTDYTSSEQHCESILEEFCDLYRSKYFTGLREHGGRLWRKNVRHMAKEEVLDFVSYVFTNHAQIDYAIYLLEEAIALEDWALVSDTYNLLTVGNPEGTKEEDK